MPALEPRGPVDIISDKYESLTKQGKGSFGVVYKAKCRKTGQQVAIKVIQQNGGDTITLKKTLAEVQILKKLSALPNNIYTTKILDLIIPDIVPG